MQIRGEANCPIAAYRGLWLYIYFVIIPLQILAYIVYGITGILGIVNHYLLPHFRKETPYLCFSKPCITSDEYDQFEVTGTLLTAPLMLATLIFVDHAC